MEKMEKKPVILFLPSNMSTVHEGKMLEALKPYGNVHFAAGTAESTKRRLIDSGAIPDPDEYDEDDDDDDDEADIGYNETDDDGKVDMIIVVAPPGRLSTDSSCSHVNVGRGIHDTIDIMWKCSTVEVKNIIFVSDTPGLHEPEYSENIETRLWDGFCADEIDQDWKVNYAKYTISEDVGPLSEAMEKCEVYVNSSAGKKEEVPKSKVQVAQKEVIKPKISRLLVARILGLI